MKVECVQLFFLSVSILLILLNSNLEIKKIDDKNIHFINRKNNFTCEAINHL